MDHFNVPKKVNRHVLKALSALSGGDHCQVIGTTYIIDQVRYQMRNLVPVPNLEDAVRKSLKNLSEIGLIDRRGMHRYALGRCAALIPGPSAPHHSKGPDRRIFHGNDPRRCSRSTLDPNMKRGRVCSDEESLSGDDFDRARKRLRTNNKQVQHCGRWAYLPRVRQHNQQYGAFAAIDIPLISQDLYSLHHRPTQLQGSCVPQCYRDDFRITSNGLMDNSAIHVMLSNVTPSPSLEISDITDDLKKIVDVRKIIETPPLQENNEVRENFCFEQEAYEEGEEGVQTDDLIATQPPVYNCEVSDNEIGTSNGNCEIRSSKLCASHRTLNTSNTVFANSQKSSKTLLLDCTKSYIK